jgi:hypothetical protein
MSPRLNWRLLLGEFVVIVVGILMALWVDELREARYNAALEIEYLASFVTDLEADLAQFDETEAWMRRSEAAAATVLPGYGGGDGGLAGLARHHAKHDRRSEVDREPSPDPGQKPATGDRCLLHDYRKRQHPQREYARTNMG